VRRSFALRFAKATHLGARKPRWGDSLDTYLVAALLLVVNTVELVLAA
jgi:hypothetical protein